MPDDLAITLIKIINRSLCELIASLRRELESEVAKREALEEEVKHLAKRVDNLRKPQESPSPDAEYFDLPTTNLPADLPEVLAERRPQERTRPPSGH